MFFDSFLEKNKHGDGRNDAMLRVQQHYFQQQQQQQHKRECLSDEVDSSRSSGEAKRPKVDLVEQQKFEKALVMVGGGGGGGDGGSADGASIEVAKRRRGRPAGSKNRPKPPVAVVREVDPPATMRPHVLEIPAGHDVADSLARFARRRNLGICVLSGSGAVANVVLRQPHFGGAPPLSAPLTVGFHGRFEILSISATFLPPAVAALSQGIGGEMSLSVSLAGPQGQVVGGTVSGPLMAAGTVVVVAAAFSNPTFHRLPAEEDLSISVSVSGSGEAEEEEQQHVNHQHQQLEHRQHFHNATLTAPAAVSAAESCGMSTYNGHISPDAIWGPPTSRPLPPPPY